MERKRKAKQLFFIKVYKPPILVLSDKRLFRNSSVCHFIHIVRDTPKSTLVDIAIDPLRLKPAGGAAEETRLPPSSDVGRVNKV